MSEETWNGKEEGYSLGYLAVNMQDLDGEIGKESMR
tara:strand:+ start:649 stop:756 length:108 start_codon:yes stop_codon:yes gene_type:complete